MIHSELAYLLFANEAAPGSATWFTPATLFTAAGSTAAVIAVTAVLQRFSSRLPGKWIALGLSEALAIGALSFQNQTWSLLNIIVAILNGVMTYAAAVGVNTAVTTPPPPAAGAMPVGARSYRWWA